MDNYSRKDTSQYDRPEINHATNAEKMKTSQNILEAQEDGKFKSMSSIKQIQRLKEKVNTKILVPTLNDLRKPTIEEETEINSIRDSTVLSQEAKNKKILNENLIDSVSPVSFMKRRPSS